ncbi:MAG: metal-dependent hydrolase [Nitrososphaeria archaeon]|nr:metal-dependent hydrolase [Nitrososphaeria archaeon]
MPELLLHFSIPFAVAKTKYNLKQTTIIATAALTPDIDALLHIHRSITHSIIITTITTIPIALLTYKKKPKYLTLLIACYLAITSHILLDTFQTYTPTLYPITENSIWIKAEGNIIISNTITPKITTTIQTTQTNFTTFQTLDAPIYTSQGLITSILLTIIPTILTRKKIITA